MDSKYKYNVVGGKKIKESGRLLSKHNTLKQAKASAKKYAEKGYYGAIYVTMKMTEHARKKYHLSSDSKQKCYFRGHIYFSPERGVESVLKKGDKRRKVKLD